MQFSGSCTEGGLFAAEPDCKMVICGGDLDICFAQWLNRNINSHLLNL